MKSSFIGGIPEGEEIEACGKLATLTQKFLCSIFFNRKKKPTVYLRLLSTCHAPVCGGQSKTRDNSWVYGADGLEETR